MNEGLSVHVLKQFKLEEIHQVLMAFISISDTISISDYVKMDPIEVPLGADYKKFRVISSSSNNIIFNSILIYNTNLELLCYVELDPQNLSTVDEWIAKISTAYSVNNQGVAYNVDFLGVYNEHTLDTESTLSQVHTNLGFDEAITVNLAQRVTNDQAHTKFIEPTINTISNTVYASVERLVVPATQDNGQNTLIKRYVNKREKAFQYSDLDSNPYVLQQHTIGRTDNTNIISGKIVDSLSTCTLFTHFLPRLTDVIIQKFDDISAEDIAKSYRYGSFYINQDKGAGFFLPLYKHESGKRNIRGCALIPNGLYRDVLLYKFDVTNDVMWDYFDFKRIPPQYFPFQFTHIIQGANGHALYWSIETELKQTYQEQTTPINDDQSRVTGLENPWLKLQDDTAAGSGAQTKIPSEQKLSFRVLYYEVTPDHKRMFVPPTFAPFRMYLDTLSSRCPKEITEFKNYCINTRDKLRADFQASLGDNTTRFAPRNFISYQILSAASQFHYDDEHTCVIEWSDELMYDQYSYKISGGCEQFMSEHGDLFELYWKDMLEAYQTYDYNHFRYFRDTHDGSNQFLVLATGEQVDVEDQRMDEYPEIPEYTIDTVNPVQAENVNSHAVLNEIADSRLRQAQIMVQDITDVMNTYVLPYVDNNEGTEYMAYDNGILCVREDTKAIYVSVIKYTGKTDTRVFRQVIQKELIDEDGTQEPYFIATYSGNIVTYRLRLPQTHVLYTSCYAMNKENPFAPVLSNVDQFQCSSTLIEGKMTYEFRICTLYHGYNLLCETEYKPNVTETMRYYIYDNLDGTLGKREVRTHGRKLIRREFFLPDD